MTLIMRNVASVLFLSLTPGALAAETLTWGQIDFKAGQSHIGGLKGNTVGNIADRDPATYDLSGRIGADWGAFGLQLDLNYSTQDIDGSVETGYYYGNYGALRATYDVNDILSFGAVYGEGQTKTATFIVTPTFNFYALEGAYSSGAGIFGLQLGAFDIKEVEFYYQDGTFARASAIYTLANGGIISGQAAYFDGTVDPKGSAQMYAHTWGVEYSRQIGTAPMAWSVGLDGGSYSSDGGDDKYDETRVTLGLLAWFGDGDYASAKRRGIFSQPEFGRIVAAGGLVD